MTTISASYDSLLGQASDTVEVYLRRAIRMLDEQFGEGYARNHPELVGQIVRAMSSDLSSATFGKTVGELADVLRDKDFSGS